MGIVIVVENLRVKLQVTRNWTIRIGPVKNLYGVDG